MLVSAGDVTLIPCIAPSPRIGCYQTRLIYDWENLVATGKCDRMFVLDLLERVEIGDVTRRFTLIDLNVGVFQHHLLCPSIPAERSPGGDSKAKEASAARAGAREWT